MKVWESPFIPSHFTFKKFRVSLNQSHNNQATNQIYLFNITFQNLEFWDVTVADPLTKFISQAKHDHSLGVNHIAM